MGFFRYVQMEATSISRFYSKLGADHVQRNRAVQKDYIGVNYDEEELIELLVIKIVFFVLRV